MTVCIAAICQQDDDPRIILCSDTRMSQGEWGSTDLTVKLEIIGRGWVVQFANRPDSAQELTRRVKEWVRSSPKLESVHAVLMAVSKAIQEFRTSPLCTPGCCELLITGFVGKKPVIIVVCDDEKKKLSVRLESSFAAIGTGATIATVILNCREYSPNESVGNAIYLAYEAKRYSEKADGVGPLTCIAVHAPGAENLDDSAVLALMNPAIGMVALGGVFNSVGLRPRLKIEPFPKELFIVPIAPQDPESTTTDPSRPQPSQESPGGSDES